MSVAYVPRDRIAIVELGTPLKLRDELLPRDSDEPTVLLIRESDAYWAVPREIVLSKSDDAEWAAAVESLLQAPALEHAQPDDEPDRPAVVLGGDGVVGVWVDLDSTGFEPPRLTHFDRAIAPDVLHEASAAWQAPEPAGAPPPAPVPAAARPGDVERRRRGRAVAESASLLRNPKPLVRTPHMNAPGHPQAVGARFTAVVWLDEEGQRAGELSQLVELHVPAGVSRVELAVWLSTSDHFSVEGDVVQPLALEPRRATSTPAVFEVSVRKVPDADEDPLLTAVFSHAGRPCGRVSRAVPIVGAPDYEPPAPPPPGPPSIHVDTRAAVADLTVVVTGDPARARHYECRVESPHLPDGWGEPAGEWPLSDSVPAVIGEYLVEFLKEDLTPFDRVAALKGAGVKLFDSAPPVFKAAYWALVDRGKPPRSIFVVSEEPHWPWELLVPRRPRPGGAGFERHDPLGVQCAMGRWVRSDNRPAGQKVTLSSAHVIAPVYDDPLQHLPMAEAEAAFVCEKFSGVRVQPAAAARLDEVLGGDPRPLVHFVGHGKVVSEVGEALVLDSGRQLTLTQLGGLAGVEDGVALGKPLIFVNACEVGRNVPSLTRIDGFAAAFTEMGASCVIAPIWSVKDVVAHAIARAVYGGILEEPAVPPAEVLRRLRAKGYGDDGEDTYLAYCFFGDPLTQLSAT